ncbi:MAG: hypothetical protein A2Z91_02800 [Deltaproteobacteria bacterium GWA2_38_16]|nr:MAG: hypothetical protein A2Z91_02800 [Deltaproteobacteria bacterium GWA2_38_16]OGQ02818.1 MAG: hypothetical protein A3D19_06225 [Deltaproteobacteria bacterium RIFCSPHIGHO2_02_FULL_38_15]OGQ34910.1 MAG: hypothetical protein A3A72_00455 [Deltaproteobacteria bacterium RIFCSPLOWO2_01_FULL_38_9]HBQ21660.1 hypothetical protein [Deltaproteobacteria bacterium]
MKKVIGGFIIVVLTAVAFSSVYALKTYNASKSNTAATVVLDSADREVTRLINEAEKEATQMASEMIRMERANGYAGKVDIQVSIDVQIVRNQNKQAGLESESLERAINK